MKNFDEEEDPYHYWDGGTRDYLDEKIHIYEDTALNKGKEHSSPIFWRKGSVNQSKKSQAYHEEAVLTEDTCLKETEQVYEMSDPAPSKPVFIMYRKCQIFMTQHIKLLYGEKL